MGDAVAHVLPGGRLGLLVPVIRSAQTAQAMRSGSETEYRHGGGVSFDTPLRCLGAVGWGSRGAGSRASAVGDRGSGGAVWGRKGRRVGAALARLALMEVRRAIDLEY